MQTRNETQHAELEQAQEVRAEPSGAIDPPAGMEPMDRDKANDGGGQGRSDVLTLLAGARGRQRREKPNLEPDQIWITLADYLEPQEERAVLDGLEVMVLAEGEQQAKVVVAGLLQKYPQLLDQIEEGISQARQKQAPDAEEPPVEPEERLQLSKAKGELIPLVRFLTTCTFREKLAGVAMDVLGYSDVSDKLGPREGNIYAGSLGDDLQNDWEDAIFAAVEGEVGTPEERALAAYLAGLSNAR